MNSNNANSSLNREIILQFLRENKDFFHKEYGVTVIALFGSYARGDETPESDIDLAIEMEVADFRKRIALRNFLQERFNKKVEVGYLNSIKPFVRRFVDKDIIYA